MDIDLAAVLENMPDGFLAVDCEGRCTAANSVAERLLNRCRADIVGSDYSTFLPRSCGERPSFEIEYCEPADGKWLEVRACPGPDGALFIYLRDITELKRATQELQSVEQRFTRFMENLPGLAWMKDTDGRYLFVNAAAARAFRSTPDELFGKTDAEIFPPDTAAQFREHDLRALESSHGILVVETLEQEDGVHYSQVSKFPVTDPEGNLAGVAGMAIDISDRVRAEEALRAADRRKDDYLAMLAHELRNPLAPILTALELFRLRAEDAGLEKPREVIERQVRHMARLLDDLLDVSRITRGKVQFAEEELDLSAILRQAVETSRPQLDAREHTLHVELPDAPLTTTGDADRLLQVFTNLLNNAARYTPAGGTVWLTARAEASTAQVSVRDTGIGMTSEMTTRAFDLFTQGNRGLDRSPGGLGVGLTLVKELTEMHGGTVTAASAGPGLGSEFLVTLPLRTGAGVLPAPTCALQST